MNIQFHYMTRWSLTKYDRENSERGEKKPLQPIQTNATVQKSEIEKEKGRKRRAQYCIITKLNAQSALQADSQIDNIGHINHCRFLI